MKERAIIRNVHHGSFLFMPLLLWVVPSCWPKAYDIRCVYTLYITTEFGFPYKSKALAHHDMHEINFVV